MTVLQETENFIRACNKAVTKIATLPDMVTKSSYAKPDLLSNARAYLAAANAVSAAAFAVLTQLDPPAAAAAKQSNQHT